MLAHLLSRALACGTVQLQDSVAFALQTPVVPYNLVFIFIVHLPRMPVGVVRWSSTCRGETKPYVVTYPRTFSAFVYH